MVEGVEMVEKVEMVEGVEMVEMVENVEELRGFSFEKLYKWKGFIFSQLSQTG